MNAEVKIFRESPDIPLPVYATAQSAGADLRAWENLTLAPGEIKSVGTGLHIQLPEGYEAQIRPRSGLALKKGISIPNAPGTIDSDYRGEIRVILVNLGKDPFEIRRGDRVAQMVIAPVAQAQWCPVETLDETERGSGGFGSTGTK
ncbi:MAG: dUTP diphosphatase [Pyramidobacter sp.]|jgi:dUTP pyrophosphatase